MDKNHEIIDTMICVMARLLKDEEIVFHGVSSHMPMIAVLLAKKMHAKHLYHLNIPGGVNPQSRLVSSYSTAGYDLYDKSEAIFPLSDVFDLSMRGKLDVAFLSGVQFDKKGNVNASVIGDYQHPKVRLPGGAGSAVLIPTAKRAIIWRTKHDQRTFVKQVDFVTARGNIDRIITPMCVFKYNGDELLLESVHKTSSISEVIANTGFKIDDSCDNVTTEPNEQERYLLKEIDPRGHRYIEL